MPSLGAANLVVGCSYRGRQQQPPTSRGLAKKGECLGSYQVVVWTKGSASSANYNAYLIAPYQLDIGPCASASLATSPASPQAAGTTITFTAASTGCTAPRYEFWLLPAARHHLVGRAALRRRDHVQLEHGRSGAGPVSDRRVVAPERVNEQLRLICNRDVLGLHLARTCRHKQLCRRRRSSGGTVMAETRGQEDRCSARINAQVGRQEIPYPSTVGRLRDQYRLKVGSRDQFIGFANDQTKTGTCEP
jgi:hypothetical protein